MNIEHSITCHQCGELADERETVRLHEGELCPACAKDWIEICQFCAWDGNDERLPVKCAASPTGEHRWELSRWKDCPK